MNSEQIAQLNRYSECVMEKLPEYSDYDKVNRLTFGLHEAAEIMGLFGKVIFQGHELDEVKLKKESGDFVFFSSATCKFIGLEFGDFWASVEPIPQRKNAWPYSDFTDTENNTIDFLADINELSAKMLTTCRRLNFNSGFAVSLRIAKDKLLTTMTSLIANFKGFLNMWELDIVEIIEMNQAKLNKRYPDGFTPEDSVRRVDTEETPLPNWDEVEPIPFDQPPAAPCPLCDLPLTDGELSFMASAILASAQERLVNGGGC